MSRARAASSLVIHLSAARHQQPCVRWTKPAVHDWECALPLHRQVVKKTLEEAEAKVAEKA